MSLTINREDPNYIILPHLRKGQQAFDGGPTIAGSFKAQQEGAIILCIFLRELELHPYWLDLPKKEDEEPTLLPEPTLPEELNKAKLKVDALDYSPQNKKFVNDWLEELLKKLYAIQAVYCKNIKEHKETFSAELNQHGYTQEQANELSDELERVMLQESQSPADCCIRRPQPEAARLATPLETVLLPKAGVSPSIDAVQEAEVVNFSSEPDSTQTSLFRVLAMHQFYANKYGAAPSIPVLSLAKRHAENRLLVEIERRATATAEAILSSGAHLPPSVRQEVRAFVDTQMSMTQVASTTPVLRPPTAVRKADGSPS